MFFKRNSAATVLTALAATACLAFSATAEAGKRRLRNTAPTISGTPAATVQAGNAYAFQPTAYDAQGTPLAFTISGKPAWASFNASSGALTGTPATASVGSYANIIITVSDGSLKRSLPAFTITVTAPPPNNPPTIAGSPVATATAGQPYAFKANGSDPDGQTLRYGIANKPAWASFDTLTGTLSGTPVQTDVGQYANVVISVSDGVASATLAPFSITVMAATSGTAELSWTAPTQNEDGSTLTNLSGYRVRYGNSPTSLSTQLTIPGPAVTSAVIEGLASGTWYFTVAAVNSAGVESAQSPAVHKTVL